MVVEFKVPVFICIDTSVSSFSFLKLLPLFSLSPPLLPSICATCWSIRRTPKSPPSCLYEIVQQRTSQIQCVLQLCISRLQKILLYWTWPQKTPQPSLHWLDLWWRLAFLTCNLSGVLTTTLDPLLHLYTISSDDFESENNPSVANGDHNFEQGKFDFSESVSLPLTT